ncbi:hypothetical protein SAMN02927924_01440 [Sphingobium faniae]|nr:hypothetical protein SAMN02927924_01440 [Sphingobium faniae]
MFDNWSTNPASNTLIDGINWSENQLPSTVNNSARQMMADLATWRNGIYGGNRFALLTGGTFTGNVTVNATFTATKVQVGSATFGMDISGQLRRVYFDTAGQNQLSYSTGTNRFIFTQAGVDVLYVNNDGRLSGPLGSYWATSDAVNAATLSGQNSAYYRDLGNSTGTLPNARISGDYNGIGLLTTDRIRLVNGTVPDPTTTNHAFQVGRDSNFNMRIGSSRIQGVNNGVASGIRLQTSGGDIDFFNNKIAFTFATGNITTSGDVSAANVTASGKVAAPRLEVDSPFYLTVTAGNPGVVFDPGDYILFNRAQNKFYFYVGGTAQASIDASGVLRVRGNVIGNTTP